MHTTSQAGAMSKATRVGIKHGTEKVTVQLLQRLDAIDRIGVGDICQQLVAHV